MADKLVARQKKPDKREDKSVVMTLRTDRELQEEFDALAAKSDRSRNELMCMAEYMYANKYLHLCFDQFTYTCKMLKF